MILLTKKKRKELASELALNITNYDEVIAEFKNKVDILTRERDAAKISARDTTRKYKRATEDLERFKSELRASEIEKNRLQNNYSELASKKTDKSDKHKIKKYKEQIIDLQNKLTDSENSRKLANSRAEAFVLIDDKANTSNIMKNLSHNLCVYLKENNINFGDFADDYKLGRETVRRMCNGTRGTSVKSFSAYEGDVCEFFGCMPIDLIEKKLEVD